MESSNENKENQNSVSFPQWHSASRPLFRGFREPNRRDGLLAVALAALVVLATGRSSTGTGFSARLVSPVSAAQQGSDLEDEGRYKPPRSPSFSDLFGG
jgi:hypothetical protein